MKITLLSIGRSLLPTPSTLHRPLPPPSPPTPTSFIDPPSIEHLYLPSTINNDYQSTILNPLMLPMLERSTSRTMGSSTIPQRLHGIVHQWQPSLDFLHLTPSLCANSIPTPENSSSSGPSGSIVGHLLDYLNESWTQFHATD
ncbi:unnamed protein product [Lactuca virosa]|uniref:Uncharacterized protein n=1 Tax=Lactuca virosa TaxID=75947 RepID=A0AAU9M5K2_9ASTR|nr:unnamed protein product [Lactuca virosa]